MASHADKKDSIDYLVENFWIKLVNLLVNSRSGNKVEHCSIAPSDKTNWFQLVVKEQASVTAEICRNGTNQRILPGKSYYVQFYLLTKERRSLILETWELSATNRTEVITKPIFLKAHAKMAGIFKSALMYTKHTPAHKCSFNQNPNWYILCLKINNGVPDNTLLGEHRESVSLGHVDTGKALLKLNVHYRTKFTLPNLCCLNSPVMPMKTDHFKQEPTSPDQPEITDETSESSVISGTNILSVPIPGFSSLKLDEISFPFTSGSASSSSEFERSSYLQHKTEKNRIVFNAASESLTSSFKEDKDIFEAGNTDESLEEMVSQFGRSSETSDHGLRSIWQKQSKLDYVDLPNFASFTNEDSTDFFTFPSLSKSREPQTVPVDTKLKVLYKYQDKMDDFMDYAMERSKQYVPPSYNDV